MPNPIPQINWGTTGTPSAKTSSKATPIPNINWSLGPTLMDNVAAQKTDMRAQGLPVSSSLTQAQPGVLSNIVRGALKLPARIGTNLVQAGEATLGMPKTQPFSGDYLGKVDAIGQNFDITKGVKYNAPALKDSAGAGLEAASWLIGGGEAKAGTQILKQGIKQFAKENGARLLAEGFSIGTTQSVGTQLQDNAANGTPLSLKKTLMDAGVATALTPVIAFGLNKLLGKNAEKVIANMPKSDVEKFVQQNVPTAPVEAPGFHPVTGKPTAPHGFSPTDGTPLQTPLQPQEFHPATGKPIQSPLPKPTVKSTISETEFKDLSSVDNTFKNTTNKIQADLHNRLTPEEIQTVLKTGESPNGVSPTYVWAQAKKEAVAKGDVQAIVDLADSPAGSSVAGQNLSLSKEGKIANDPVEAIQQINESRASTIAKDKIEGARTDFGNVMKKAQNDLFNKLIC